MLDPDLYQRLRQDVNDLEASKEELGRLLLRTSAALEALRVLLRQEEARKVEKIVGRFGDVLTSC